MESLPATTVRYGTVMHNLCWETDL